jgi:hypothetical protein
VSVLLIALGVVIGSVVLALLTRYDNMVRGRGRARMLARLEQEAAERRVQQITQAAVQRMLDIARFGGR